MNPLMHGKNTAANWFIGKAAEAITGHAFQPKWYGDNIRAGMKAVNLLREMGGAEYNRLLRLGLDLQCKSDYMDQTSRDFLRGLVEQLGQDKESNRAMSVLMAVPDAAKWLKRTNHTLTFGMNDLFLAQSFYARQAELIAKGMSPDLADMAARDWAHQQVVEYMTPIRMMGSAPLGRVMENQNIALFMRYRFGGKIRPLMNAVKEAIGSFKPDENMTEAMGGALGRTTDTASGQQEETYGERNARGQTRAEARTNAIARLAVMIGMAAYIYPKLDRIAKRITHDAQAKFPRGGAMEDVVHVAESLKGERSWGATASADFSLALATEEIPELIANRDFYTWHHIRGTNVGTEDQTMQLASWLGSKTMPGQMTHRWDQGRGKQVLFGLLGFTFPMEHGVKEAAEVRSDKSGSNPAPPQAEKVWQSILAASEQAQRSGGKDTRLEDALLASGKLTKSQEDELQDAVYDPPIVFAVNGMNGQEVWRVYGKSTDEEKRQLLDDDKIYEKLSEYGDSLRDNEDDKTADAIDKELTASH